MRGVQVTVEGAEQRGRGRQQHTVYILAVEASVSVSPGSEVDQRGKERRSWRVERRWSEFQALRSALVAVVAPGELPSSWAALSKARSFVSTSK